MWRQISQQGKKENCPGPVAYHTSVVYKEQMFLFGGNNYAKTVQTYSTDEKNFTPLYSINIKLGLAAMLSCLVMSTVQCLMKLTAPWLYLEVLRKVSDVTTPPSTT
jgi:hypothetical protein